MKECDLYIWEPWPGHWEWEAWDDVQHGHLLERGRAKTFGEACDRAFRAMEVNMPHYTAPSFRAHLAPVCERATS